MTDEAMIRVIAEFDGWMEIVAGQETGTLYGLHPLHAPRFDTKLPPYLTSLDAIVPVCSKLNANQKVEFGIKLDRVVTDLDAVGYETSPSWRSTNATARQRCEALVRTLGKWEEV